LADNGVVQEILGNNSQHWAVSEIGDGNLNLVFRLRGDRGELIAKQALPYIRARGEDWPLPLSRAYFEYEALVRQKARSPETSPAVFLFDDNLALTIMEFLSPHIILRKGLVQGIRYPRLAKDMGSFLAHNLFRGSQFFMPKAVKTADKELFLGNGALCDVTDARVFTEPYQDAVLNRWTSPQLDDVVVGIRADNDIKSAIAEMKHIYRSSAQSLLHGDLHSGSVMVTESDTRVIDPEFAFYGPMGFDIGALLANLLISYISQPAHATTKDDRKNYAAWILTAIEGIWSTFVTDFTQLWHRERVDGAGTETDLKILFAEVFKDTLGFAAAKMIRRVIGAAHVEDLESITNPDERANREKEVLRLARTLLLERHGILKIEQVSELAREH